MKTQFKQYNVTATYTGSKKAPWAGQDNWNHHKVTIYNRNDKTRTSFDFWASIMEPELRTRYDALNAFYCFVTDAISGEMDFNEFCNEYGYDNDSRSAEKIWKSCQKSTAKIQKVVDEDLYDLANELNEIAG